MRESDQRLSEYILGDDHGYESRSPYYHSYEDAPEKRDHFGRTAGNYLQGSDTGSNSRFSRGDRVQVGGPLGGYGTVENVFTTDSNVRVRMDATYQFIVFPECRVQVIEKKERDG